MNLHLGDILVACTLSMTSTGCGSLGCAPQTKAFRIVLAATSDDGEPVRGAKFATEFSTLGTTDERGKATVSFRGVDGQAIAVRVACPEGFVSPEVPTALRLTEVRRVNQGEPSPLRLEATCTRRLREVVVVVRTTSAPTLPVDIGGKTVGETDGYGNAHYRLQLDRSAKSLSVSLGTSAMPALRPQNPSRIFELTGQDAILIVDQSFSVDPKLAARRRLVVPAKPNRAVPYRLGS